MVFHFLRKFTRCFGGDDKKCVIEVSVIEELRDMLPPSRFVSWDDTKFDGIVAVNRGIVTAKDNSADLSHLQRMLPSSRFTFDDETPAPESMLSWL